MPRRILLAPLALVAVLGLPRPAVAADPTSSVVTTPARRSSPFVTRASPRPTRRGSSPSRARRRCREVTCSASSRHPRRGTAAHRTAAPPLTVTGGAFSATARSPGGGTCRSTPCRPAAASPADLTPVRRTRYFGAEPSDRHRRRHRPERRAGAGLLLRGSTSPDAEGRHHEHRRRRGARTSMAPIDDSRERPAATPSTSSTRTPRSTGRSSTSGETRSQLRSTASTRSRPTRAASALLRQRDRRRPAGHQRSRAGSTSTPSRATSRRS